MSEVRWVTLLEAGRPHVEVVRGVLDAEGIATFVPDDLTKTVDPFITGGNAFTVELQVPAEDVARARALLAAREGPDAPAEHAAEEVGGPEDAGLPSEADEDDGEEENDGEPDEGDPVERLAARTMFSAILVVAMPLTVVFGVLYLFACRRHGRRSTLHGLVLFAFLLALGVVTGALLYALLPPAQESERERGPTRREPPIQTTPIGPR